MSKEYYRPLPDCVTPHEAKWLSKITGKFQLGLFATEFIPDGTILGVTHVPDERFQDGLIRTPLGGFFNHTDNPNIELVALDDGIRHMHTLRNINEGDEITATYYTYDPTK